MKKSLLLVGAGTILFSGAGFAQSNLMQSKATPAKKTAALAEPGTSTANPAVAKMVAAPHDLCGTMQHLKWMEAQDPTYTSRLEAAAKKVADYALAHQSATDRATGLITLPVVVHVIYNNSVDPNMKITTSAVNSQITVLNQDFTRTNPDASSTPSAFTSVAANVGVNFCLAQKDPSGNPTTGIVYVATTQSGFTTNDNVKFTSKGGDNQWDPTKYLNIWVCDLADLTGGVLGYGEFPTSPLDNTFGVVCDYRCFGTIGSYLYSGYTGGRTMTHEFSHCFNLHHTWGDDGGLCPSGGGTDDGAADTPVEGNSKNDGFGNGTGPTFGCPTFPYKDNCSTTSPGIMFMNFMNYTSDNCKNIFTADQKTIIINTLNTLMPSLMTSSVCAATTPPVADFVASATTIPAWSFINFTDLSTQSPTAWAWTLTGGTPSSSTVQNPTNIQFTTPGNYTISLKATNGFGNNTATKTNYIHVVVGQACDTVTNLHATDTLTYYISQNSSSVNNGYVLGINGYGIQSEAEYFASYPSPGFQIYSAYIYTGVAYSKTAKSVTVTVWDNTGAGGGPGVVKGSKVVPISSFSTSSPTLISFTTPITVTTPFFVGLDYTSLASSTTDSIAIVSNMDGETLPGTAWEKYSNTWYTVQNLWGINVSSAIWVNFCTSPTGIGQYTLEEGVKLFPNPTSGKVSAQMSFDMPTDVNVDVFNMLGQNVRQTRWEGVTNNTYTIDLSSEPAGMYIVKMTSAQGTITKKIMVNR